MGGGSFSASSYRDYASKISSKAVEEIFTHRSMDSYLDPKGIKIREARDSAGSPNSTPLIVGVDVTGSMGKLAGVVAKKGLGVLFQEVLDSKPITDPHLMFMAIGDAHHDRAPLQVSQFETDNKIIEQLEKIWIEHGGGGNDSESYNLPWYFAARHTSIDSMIKRGKRGYLFTVGDEEAPENVTKDQIQEFIGDTLERNMSSEEMLAECQRMYDVFHVIITEGDHYRHSPDAVVNSWTEMLGQHVIKLDDHTKLAEVIVATLEMVEGKGLAGASRFGGAVVSAVKHLPKSKTPRLALTGK